MPVARKTHPSPAENTNKNLKASVAERPIALPPVRQPNGWCAAMAQILYFVRPNKSLDPETLEILGAAYDKAVASLQDGMSDAVCEEIAGRLIEAGAHGERDPDALHELALRGI
jgi:hypothetical protein